MRAIPGLQVVRPADAHEAVEAWKLALLYEDGPTALVFTRQGLPVLPPPPEGAVARGGYVLRDGSDPQVVLVGTGSEVSLCMQAADRLAAEGIRARVVSMPCVERFLDQAQDVRDGVLPAGVPVVSIEAGITLGWERIVGTKGIALGIDSFGASAPAADLAEHFGFTADRVVEAARRVLG